MSQHATVRSQQRGFPLQLIDLILDFGTPAVRPGNAIEYCLTKRDRARLIQNLDKINGKAVLIAGDTILTVYNKR